MADPYVVTDYWVDGYTTNDTGEGEGEGLPDSYPAIPQREGTKFTLRTGILMRRASNGATRLRALQSMVKRDILIDHGACTEAEYLQLMAFYAQYQLQSFSFTAWEDDVTRTCVFAPVPFDVDPQNGGIYRIKVGLIEV